MQPQPELEFERSPCPRCGAVDIDDANGKCRPSQDETGEYWCAGEFGDGGENDGYSIRPTAASLAALNEWCQLEGRRNWQQRNGK